MNKKLYRAKDGIIFGVCKGIANYFDLSLFWVRAVFLTALAITMFFPTGLIYLALALILKKEPGGSVQRSQPTTDPISARSLHLNQLKDKFTSLENRIRRIESHVTDKAYDWEKRLNNETGH